MPTSPNFSCHACNRELLAPKSTDGVLRRLSVGDLVLCGTCAATNLITVMGTRALSEKEIATMPEDVAKELRFAARAIKNLQNN